MRVGKNRHHATSQQVFGLGKLGIGLRNQGWRFRWFRLLHITLVVIHNSGLVVMPSRVDNFPTVLMMDDASSMVTLDDRKTSPFRIFSLLTFSFCKI